MTNDLAKKAMLVKVSIVNGGLLGERKDSKATRLVENTYHIADNRTRASKYLIDRNHKAVKTVVAASQRIRQIVYNYTNPWADDKIRLLATALHPDFDYEAKKAIKDLEKTWDAYVRLFPSLVAASERDLGDLFDASQYPSADKVRALFTVKVNYWPLPTSGHFVAEITEQAAKEAKKAIETEVEERLFDATKDMVDRAKKVVVSFIEKLENTSVIEDMDMDLNRILKLDGVLRDSLTKNIDSTINLIDKMNITGSLQVNKVIRDLKRLQVYSAVWWRSHPDTYRLQRPIAIKTAKEIKQNLDALAIRDHEIEGMISVAVDYMD